MLRQATWDVLESEGQSHRVRVSVFAMPEEPSPTPGTDCAPSISSVWLWPLTRAVKAGRRQRESLCSALEEHAETRARVEQYQADRARLLSLIDEIQKLRREKGAAEEPPSAEAPDPSP